MVALHKDLVVEWPPRTYSAALSYMALLDAVSGPLLVGCILSGRHKEVAWVMNIKLSVNLGFHGYGHGCRAARPKLTRCILLSRTCEKSGSETLPAHLGSVLGSHDLGHMGIMTWSEHALCRVKTDISAMLTDTSGPDLHMRSKLGSQGYLVLARLLPRVWQDGYLFGFLPHVTIGGCYLCINNCTDDD
jgi:hypothetical protein